MFQNAGEKGTRIKTQRIHHVGVGTNAEVMTLMRMIVLLLSARWP